MTALTLSRPDVGSGPVTQSRVIRSEWIKLRSLRSTWWSLFAAVVIMVGLGTLFSALRAHRFNQVNSLGGRLIIDATEISLRGVFLAQLAIGVFGVLVITGEYATGMIRATIGAVPRRQPVLFAKASVFAVMVFVITYVAAFAAFLLGQIALHSTHEQASLSTPGALRAILGAALYLTIIGLLGVGLGFILRNTAGAIATLVGIVLVLPLLANALPSPYSTDVDKYLPLNAGTQALATVGGGGSGNLAPWPGMGITALYALAALLLGMLVLARKDA